MQIKANGITFEASCDMMDVTSLSRPDTSWRLVDSHGHGHRWYADGKPAEHYNPSARYEIPTIVWRHERWGYYEDGMQYSIGDWICKECLDIVKPATCADTHTRYIPGLKRYSIDGQGVTEKEFMRRAKEAGLLP